MPTVRHMKAKLALMGEGGVGKTSLIRRFVLNEYQDTYLHTVGTRVSKVELTVPHGADTEVQMDMSIFDIMGQRGFKDLVRETYYHGSQALMGVCDLTRKDSLYALNEWIPSALEIAGDVPVYLVVNKKDLEERRAITEDEIRHVAEPFAAPIVYTSARTGTFVEDAFNALAAVWRNTTASNYASQVLLLRDTGVTVNGTTYRLNSTTMHDDGGAECSDPHR